jgi:hypothetical protein
MSFEEWLESTSYNQQRKDELRLAWHGLRGGLPTLRECRHIDEFIKSEFYPEWKHARHINSRTDKFKVVAGPAFKAVEDIIYNTMPEFIKHIPVPDRPAHIRGLRRDGRRYFQTDFTAFESHFSPELMDICECALYRHMLAGWEGSEFICKVLTGKNKMRTRSGFSAWCYGRRMSGDMCTSLGNGFTNLMLAKFLAAEQGKELYGFVEGDDGLFSTEAELRAQDYADLGFTIKIDEIRDPCLGSFCGMVFGDSGHILRDPRRFIEGFGWTLSFVNAGDCIMDGLLRSKALSACYETPCCPIVGAFAQHALRCTEGVVPVWVPDGYHTRPPDEENVPDFSPTAGDREIFAALYHIPVVTQLAIEKRIWENDMLGVSVLLPPPPAIADFSSKYVTVT